MWNVQAETSRTSGRDLFLLHVLNVEPPNKSICFWSVGGTCGDIVPGTGHCSQEQVHQKRWDFHGTFIENSTISVEKHVSVLV